jgi:hypothetical protein
MADYFKFDGIDGENQMNQPSWGLDRIDQRAPDIWKQDADPFLVYGEPREEDIGLSLILKSEAPSPDDGLIVVVTPVLDPAAIGLVRAEIVYL